MNTIELKEKYFNAVDQIEEQVREYVLDIERHAELGFEEHRTSEKMFNFLEAIGYKAKKGIAVTGVEAVLEMGQTGPVIALMGELDAIICRQAEFANPITGAAHQCGHHVQQGVLLAVAAGLAKSKISNDLCGKVKFLGVPAEEMGVSPSCQKLIDQGKIQYVCGKPQMILEGVFDDVDISMMMHCWSHHSDSLILRGVKNLGAVTILLNFFGKQAHAAAEPFNGINALNAAIAGINAVNALRESFNESDSPRVNYIITNGGEMVNCIPDYAQVKINIRANTLEAMMKLIQRILRAFKISAETLGARMEYEIEGGVFPLVTDDRLFEIYVNNAKKLLPSEPVHVVDTMPSSSDLGDLSQLMPVLYPMGGGIEGTGHGADFKMVDFINAVITPAKLLGAVIIDLLVDRGTLANKIIENYQPGLTKEEYLEFWRKGIFNADSEEN